ISFFFSSRRRHTRWPRDWSSDVCSSDLDRIEVGRAQPRFAALAFNRFDHRGLFAADVGTGTAAQENRRNRAWRIRLQRGDFGLRSEERRVGKEWRLRWSPDL